jgi:hypothetical protein
MGKERLPLRVDPETKDALSEYADEQDVSNSEAGRRMLRAGLSQSGYEVAVADGMGINQLDVIRDELGTIEERQAEIIKETEQRRTDEQRHRHIMQSQVLAGAGGILWAVATLTLDMGQWWWLLLGVVFMLGCGVTTYYATEANR